MQLFIIAGEHSGDVYGACFLSHLKQLSPDLQAVGVGGPLMREQGLQTVLPMEEFQVMGFADIMGKLPNLLRQFIHVRNEILDTNPDGVLFIDYPGFNLRMAKALRKRGYRGKLVHYVCPTVWAWGKKRMHTLTRTLDLLLAIFPFEPALFTHTSLPTHFVGHPLIEKIRNYNYDRNWTQKTGIEDTDRLLGIFPGSRTGEVQRVLSRQLAAAKKVQQKDPATRIAVSCAEEKLHAIIEEKARALQLKVGKDLFVVPRKYSYELMQTSRSALACSGTINLELALHRTPTVVAYEVSTANLLILWYILRLFLPHYSMVNILCKRRIFPEFILDRFKAEDLFEALLPLHRESDARALCLQGCQEAYEALCTSDQMQPSLAAATAISSLLQGRS